MTDIPTGTGSMVGLRHKQSLNPDTLEPYEEGYADKAKSIPPAVQGPNAQSIVASGMTVEEWKVKHPRAVLGPSPEDIGQITTDPPDGSDPLPRPMEATGEEDAPQSLHT